MAVTSAALMTPSARIYRQLVSIHSMQNGNTYVAMDTKFSPCCPNTKTLPLWGKIIRIFRGNIFNNKCIYKNAFTGHDKTAKKNVESLEITYQKFMILDILASIRLGIRNLAIFDQS